jgi:hypothetical protein
MTEEQFKEIESRYFALNDVIRPLASKEKATRAEIIALTHMQTASLWLNAELMVARAMLKQSAQSS